MFERLQIDEDVDQRLDVASGTGCCRGGEDRPEGIESSLPGRAPHQIGRHRLAVLGDAAVPIGVELGLTEPVEHLAHRHPSNHPTTSIEHHLVADDAEMGVTMTISMIMSPVGAIGISERFPTPGHDLELVEPQPPGVTDQQPRRLRKELAAARVGVHPSEQPQLIDTKLS